MAVLPKSIIHVIESFESLPGIGPKSAARLAFYLLRMPQERLTGFAQGVENIKRNTVLCSTCFNVADCDPCTICTDSARDKKTVCVVEQTLDFIAMESAANFKGVYHVLGGVIDPLNNIGPDEIRVSELIGRIKKGKIKELLIATNPSMEGEATALFIKNEIEKLARENPAISEIKLTRLAHGLPVGADIEFSDSITLQRAIEGRTKI